MWHKRLTHWFGLILVIALASAPGGARASPNITLHEQNNQHGGDFVSSMSYTGIFAARSDQVADDFTLDCQTSSCQIEGIVLTGQPVGTYPGTQFLKVRVQFYTDPEIGIPGELVSEYLIDGANVVNIADGNYQITLNPPLTLGGGTWWLSVQTVNTAQNSIFAWTWSERILTSPSLYPSAWRNPDGGSFSGKPCPNWAPRLSYCQYPFLGNHAPDQMFDVNGISNTGVNPTPYINRLVPYHVLPGAGDFTLTLRGNSFVAGSQVRWNGVPVTATTTFVSNSELQVAIPAAMVAAQQVVPITVFNPAAGGGTSNTRIFMVGVPMFLPVIRR